MFILGFASKFNLLGYAISDITVRYKHIAIYYFGWWLMNLVDCIA